MAEEIDVELEATGRDYNRKHDITYVDGKFTLRFAHGAYVEESFKLLKDLLREAAVRFDKTTEKGHGVLDDGTTVLFFSVDDEVRRP
jgi:hypothetical protein